MNKQRVQRIFSSLTTRQKEVLEMFLYGKSDKDIASDLFITQATVRKNIQNICEAFEFTNEFPDERHQKRKDLYNLIQENMPELMNQSSTFTSTKFDQANNFYIERPFIESVCCRAITSPGCLLQRSQIDNERGRIEDKSDNGADQL